MVSIIYEGIEKDNINNRMNKGKPIQYFIRSTNGTSIKQWGLKIRYGTGTCISIIQHATRIASRNCETFTSELEKQTMK